ncbi:MAG: metal-sensing transcriptional repressor [Acidobacteria bacterium]|nr:metal-sensing transcriptional repressor [Acidobacteriota bacterium]
MPKKRRPVAESDHYLTAESQKALADRLARAEGHLRSVRQMVIDHRCADEILLQISAVKAAINRVAAILVEEEMRSCVTSCMPGSEEERLDRITRALGAILNSK